MLRLSEVSRNRLVIIEIKDCLGKMLKVLFVFGGDSAVQLLIGILCLFVVL